MRSCVEALFSVLSLERGEILPDGDTHGFVSEADHIDLPSPTLGSSATITLELVGTVGAESSDQVFVLDLGLLGDDTILLADSQVVIVVPAAAG